MSPSKSRSSASSAGFIEQPPFRGSCRGASLGELDSPTRQRDFATITGQRAIDESATLEALTQENAIHGGTIG